MNGGFNGKCYVIKIPLNHCKSHGFHWFSIVNRYKWPCSIAFCMFTRPGTHLGCLRSSHSERRLRQSGSSLLVAPRGFQFRDLHLACIDVLWSFGIPSGYPAWWTYKKLLKMAIEIVDFPINSMVIFHSKMLVHQRVWRLQFAMVCRWPSSK